MFKAREISKYFFIFASSIIFFLCGILLLAAFIFFLKGSLSVYVLYIAFLATISFVLLSCRIYFNSTFVPKAALLVILLTASLLVAGYASRQFFDISYDGQTYHQEALFHLARGWNPFYTELSQDQANNLHIWVNHYPKGAEIYEAVVFQFTNNVEDTKLFQIMLILAALCFALPLLLNIKRLEWWHAILIALLLAFNPVSLYQTLSLYIDGQLSSLLAAMLCVGIITYFSRRTYPYFVLGMIIVIMLNLKLTSIAFIGIFAAALLAILFLAERVAEFFKAAGFIVIALFVGIVFVGFNPYITNTIHKGHPLYPAGGPHAIDYRPDNMPENLLDKNYAESLFLSAFARSDLKRRMGEFATYKLPFTFDEAEIKSFSGVGPIEGGWGPLFGGALLLCLAIFVVSLRKKENTIKTSTAIGAVAILTLSAAIHPISSYARYVPQFYFVAVYCVFYALMHAYTPVKVLGYALLIILASNTLLIAKQNISHNKDVTQEWHQTLERLASDSKSQPLKVNFGLFRSSAQHRFQKYGIQYEEMPLDSCPNPQRLFLESVIAKC